MNQILDKYLDCIISYTKRNKTESDKIRTELKDHLLKKIDDLKSQGLSENEAVFKAIEDHGDPWNIGYKLRKKGFPVRTLTGIACLFILILSFLVIMPATARLRQILFPIGDDAIVIAGPQANANLQVEPGRSLKVISSNGSTGIFVFTQAFGFLFVIPVMIMLVLAALGTALLLKKPKKINPALA